MQMETALRWSWMNVLNRKRYEALLSRYGNVDAALSALSPELLGELGIRGESAMKAMVRAEECDSDSYGAELIKRNLRLVTFEDDDYPALLREVPDAPIFLSVRGDLSILERPCIGIVGSRDMSDYGRRVVGHIVPPMVAAGVVTVSGLAYGIDAEVAKETIRASGKTVAVLGHGLGMMYPKANERLAQDIVASGGLILSEFPLDTRPDKYTFPARNRIIAGSSLATVVVEASEESGSLITAELALEYGRDVCAVPGDLFDPRSAGCHAIIAKGHAKLVTSAADVLGEVGIVQANAQGPAPAVFTSDSPDEVSVYAALSSLPAALDDLAVKTELEAATLNAVLTILELKSVVRNVGGGRWVRV